ncbi:MAG: hypothetical protein AAF745_15215 [Planctomycetota bacterium]
MSSDPKSAIDSLCDGVPKKRGAVMAESRRRVRIDSTLESLEQNVSSQETQRKPNSDQIRRGSPFRHHADTENEFSPPKIDFQTTARADGVDASGQAALDLAASTTSAVNSDLAPADLIVETTPSLLAEHGVAMAAPIASSFVLLFSAACYVVFPSGGLLVSSLGSGLATMGCLSPRRRWSALLLAVHVSVFFGCYWQVI